MTVRGRGIDLDTFSVASAQITSEASITATTSATGNTCITTGAFTVENPGVYFVDVWAPYITKGTTNIDVELFEGASAAAGTLLTTLSGHLAADGPKPSYYVVRVTLASGGHNLTVTAFVDGGTGKFGANNGATGNAPNAWMRVRPA
jgi:hypothetical protein